jgi:uncharacterized NAD(P)/FAD-binding protein YdhS
MRTPTVVIIGAGFSGAMTAVQLMRRARTPLRIVLVNKSGRMARGLAYGTRSPFHLLNVPAGNMSALPDSPNDFVEFCRWADPDVAPHSFVPRMLYGAYLEALLSRTESEGNGRAHTVLEHLTGEVLDLERVETDTSSTVRLTLDDGRQLECDTVVLAFGHFLPRDILPRAALDAFGNRYVADPWVGEPLQGIPRHADVLLVGSGLTALDVTISLNRLGHTGRITCVSRRGLMPRGHRVGGAPATGRLDGASLAAAMGTTLRRQLRTLRTAMAQASARGEDWRDVIGALRPHTPALWRALDFADRRRFLRHVRPYWDVLRHRCAPEALQLLEELQRAGRFDTLAGRIRTARVAADDGRPELTINLRGPGEPWTRRFDFVINCTGPGSDLTRSAIPLLEQLLQQGRLKPDPLGLGLAVDDCYAVLNGDGTPQPWLRYIGPMLKARDWEAVAVPELRVHAQRLAAELLGSFESDLGVLQHDAGKLVLA